jgi:tetratricopeptide (TPR) repeat protein
MPKPISHYCQKCLAANPLGQDFCSRCGTRLMIIVDPPGARFDVADTNISTDEHLLERISALENKNSRLTERLERGLDLLLRQAQNSYFDRSLVKALIGLLTDDGIVQSERLERLWGERCQDDAVEQEESVHRDELRLRILAGFSGSDRHTFEELINEGFLLIEDKQLDRGVGVLQQASELSRRNSSLDLFIGEHFFRNGKIKLAREHLSRAHQASPDDLHISLLLGLTCADDGEVELAKQLLNHANERGGSSFAAHYGLGRLFVAEKNWPHALREFKRALSIKPSPEAHYVLACLYYQLRRDGLATRHLLKAIEMDGNYSEALQLLALVYRRKGREKLAEGALKKAKLSVFASTAVAKRRRGSRSNQERPGLNKKKAMDVSSIAPLFQVPTSRSRRLMTGADKRLAEALREDALKAFTLPQTENSSR